MKECRKAGNKYRNAQGRFCSPKKKVPRTPKEKWASHRRSMNGIIKKYGAILPSGSYVFYFPKEIVNKVLKTKDL